jgi:peptidoglycan LD-endopeptidase LytH
MGITSMRLNHVLRPNTRLFIASTIILAASGIAIVSKATGISPPETATAPAISASPFPALKASQLHDSFNEIHFGHRHQAIDIMQPYDTPIHAVTDGTIRKLFRSRAGGITIYEFNTTGTYCYYYAHLDRYADGLAEGMPVKHGQVIGYVGTSGDAKADAPHLHLAILRLRPDKRWWKGTPVDPYPVLVGFLNKSSSKMPG